MIGGERISQTVKLANMLSSDRVEGRRYDVVMGE